MKYFVKNVYCKWKMLTTKKTCIVTPCDIILTPRTNGKECKGNGEHPNRKEAFICCCDACDYFLFCYPNFKKTEKQVFCDKH